MVQLKSFAGGTDFLHAILIPTLFDMRPSRTNKPLGRLDIITPVEQASTRKRKTTTSTFSRRDRHHFADQFPVDLKLLQRRLRIQFTAQATIKKSHPGDSPFRQRLSPHPHTGLIKNSRRYNRVRCLLASGLFVTFSFLPSNVSFSFGKNAATLPS